MKICEESCWGNPFIEELLKAHPAKFGLITESAGKFRFQVLVSEVTHDQNPRFVRYGYRLDNEYFYPASAIKLCVPAAIPQKFRTLQHSLGRRVTCTTPVSFYPILEDNNVCNLHCPNGRTEMTTVAHEIRKLFLIKESMDFSEKNCMNLLDLQNLLVKLVRYDIELQGKPIEIEESFRAMLKEAMCQYPNDSCNPKFLESEYADDYCKFFLPGLSRVRPKGALRVYNKVGRAYGFSVDNAYIFDIETGHCFFLSAVIYTNGNGILNDDVYEYEVADRVMADLAEVVARALWKIPGNTFSSSYYDCIPSSLWKTRESTLFSYVINVESSQPRHGENPVHPEDEPSEKNQIGNFIMPDKVLDSINHALHEGRYQWILFP